MIYFLVLKKVVLAVLLILGIFAAGLIVCIILAASIKTRMSDNDMKKIIKNRNRNTAAEG